MSKINKANYTKGEWKIDKELTANGAPIIVSNTCWQNRKREIAKVLYAFGSEDPEVQANARLVTAAPDLLAACKEAYNHAINDPISRLDQPQLSKLRKAIAKAEGK